MAIAHRLLVFMTIPFITVMFFPFFGWARVDESRQGHVLTVEGQAFVARAGNARPQLVSFHGQVHPHDVIETQLASRVKVLLPQDILLTIGENSRVELAQFSIGGSQQARLICERGIIRVNVGPLPGAANGITVQTPMGRMVSQGAYFIMWAGEQLSQIGSVVGGIPASSGVFNLGPEGSILLTVDSASVTVRPGQVAIVDAAQHPRLVSQSHLPALTTVVEATELKDVPTEKPAKEILASISSFAPMLFTPPAVISGAAAAALHAGQSAISPATAGAPVASLSPASPPTSAPAPVASLPASVSPVVSPAPGLAPSTVATVPAALSSTGQLLNSLLGNGQVNGNGQGGVRRR
ncbi:FecR domain-containing protein [Nitrospira sp. Nam74]